MTEDGELYVDGPHPLVISLERHENYWVATERAVLRADGRKLVRFHSVSGSHVLKVLVATRGAQAVELRTLRAAVLARRPPRPVREDCATTSALPERPCTIDLDQEPPRVVAEHIGFPVTVTASDPEMFVIRPLCTVDEVRWQLELDWTYAGRPGTTVIPDDGNGFLLCPRR